MLKYQKSTNLAGSLWAAKRGFNSFGRITRQREKSPLRAQVMAGLAGVVGRKLDKRKLDKQTLHPAELHDCEAIAHADFFEHAMNMVLHRLLREEQLRGDLLVG